jgi:SET domain-containing protein
VTVARGRSGNGRPENGLPFELRESPIAGLGAFATRPIKKGTRIIEYTGERISNAEADRRYDEDKMASHHTFLFTLNRQTVVDAAVGGNEARFINHSCAPNCEAVIVDGRRIYIEALQDIPVGAELVYDYQYERTDEHTREDEQFYACQCGAPQCRGTILAPKKKAKKRARARRATRRR